MNVTNTIVVSCPYGIYNAGGVVGEDYNLFAVGTDTGGAVSHGGHSISGGTPAFIDPAGDDYHITADSDAVDAGLNLGVALDVDGDRRPFGAGVDIGADEMCFNAYLPLVMHSS